MTCNPLRWPKIDLLTTQLMHRVVVVFHEFSKIWLKLPSLFMILLGLLFKDGGEMSGCFNLGLLEFKKGNIVKAQSLYKKACDGGINRARKVLIEREL